MRKPREPREGEAKKKTRPKRKNNQKKGPRQGIKILGGDKKRRRRKGKHKKALQNTPRENGGKDWAGENRRKCVVNEERRRTGIAGRKVEELEMDMDMEIDEERALSACSLTRCRGRCHCNDPG